MTSFDDEDTVIACDGKQDYIRSLQTAKLTVSLCNQSWCQPYTKFSNMTLDPLSLSHSFLIHFLKVYCVTIAQCHLCQHIVADTMEISYCDLFLGKARLQRIILILSTVMDYMCTYACGAAVDVVLYISCSSGGHRHMIRFCCSAAVMLVVAEVTCSYKKGGCGVCNHCPRCVL